MTRTPNGPAPAGAPPSAASRQDATSAPEATPLDAPRDGTPPLLVSTEDVAAYAAQVAAGAGPVAVDTERASGFRYSDRAYLVQVRRAGAGTALIDPIAAGSLAPLAEAINPLEWVLHSADQDLPCLAELGLHPETLFDTELAGRLLDVGKVNLAAMVRREFGLALAKGHGGSDWSRRPLPHEWLVYAALDVELLIELRHALADELAAAGKSAWARQEFDHVRLSPAPPPRTDLWRKTSGIHRVRNPRSLAAVRSLWLARDELARSLDRAPGRVLPDAAIIDAARSDPSTARELQALKVFGGPRQRRRSGRWLDALASARRLREDQLPPCTAPGTVPAPGRWSRTEPEAAERLSAARTAIDGVAEDNTLPSENLLAPRIVKQLCWDGVPLPGREQADRAEHARHAVHERIDDYLRSHGARDWQRALVIDPLTAALSDDRSAAED